MLIIILSGGIYILNHARSESPPTVFTRNSNCAYKPTVSASLISARWRDTSHGWPLTISRGTSTFSEFMFSSCQSIPVTTRLIACNWLSQPLSTFTPLIFSAIFAELTGRHRYIQQLVVLHLWSVLLGGSADVRFWVVFDYSYTQILLAFGAWRIVNYAKALTTGYDAG